MWPTCIKGSIIIMIVQVYERWNPLLWVSIVDAVVSSSDHLMLHFRHEALISPALAVLTSLWLPMTSLFGIWPRAKIISPKSCPLLKVSLHTMTGQCEGTRSRPLSLIEIILKSHSSSRAPQEISWGLCCNHHNSTSPSALSCCAHSSSTNVHSIPNFQQNTYISKCTQTATLEIRT